MRATIPALVVGMMLLGRAQDTSFHSQARVVLVPVTVTDNKGRFVDGLAAGDFELLDNGRPQKIATVDTFGTGVAPIALVVAIQSAGASAPALAKIRHAGSMIVPLISGERGVTAVVSFDSQVHVMEDFTADTAAVAHAFQAIKGEGETTARMVDAVELGIRMLATRPDSRRVLLIISESRDRGSKAKLADVMRAAERFDVSIYAASYSVYATTFVSKPEDVPQSGDMNLLAPITELARLGKTNTVHALAAATGGSTAWFTRVHALENIVERIGTELHSQYILAFVPADLRPGYHQLTVRLADNRDLRVRARPGYEATAVAPAGGSPVAPDEW